jgi:GPH family glycoside/pentoside/hexuronide:cation symporter
MNDDLGKDRPALSRAAVIGYGAASGPFEMLRGPGVAILPALYAKEFGFALTALSLAMLLLRLSDGATDVAVGMLSDRTRSRWGPRKPWLLASIPLALLSAWGLFIPGEEPSIWYFAVCYFFFYLAWTFFDIPYTAWSAELGRSYEERSRLSLSRQFWGNIGLILLSLAPLLPFLPSTSMNFDTLEVMFWFIAIAYPIGVLYAVSRVPNGEFVPAVPRFSLKETVRAVRENPPLQIFLGVAFLSDLALGISGAMFFLFLDTYLGIGASFSLIFITAVAVSTVALKPWQMLLSRTSKRNLFIVSAGGMVLWGLLIHLVEPGPWALPAFIAYMALYYTLSAGREVALYAIIGDIVDYGEWRSGTNRAGEFTSAWMVIRKLTYAMGPAIGFFIAGQAGYEPTAASNDASGILGLKTANGYLPALLFVLATWLALRYPLTAEKHRIIRRRLEQRAARKQAAANPAIDPATP